MCVVFCTCFTTIAGCFTARFKMHPFISTMANMLIIFGLTTYATKGVSFGAIESAHSQHRDHAQNQRLPHHHPVGESRPS